MDDRTRDDLLLKLAAATKRGSDVRQKLEAHGANINEVRQALGNPYCYSGRPADAPDSKAHFTGYRSHEPAFLLWQDWQKVSGEVAAIRKDLRDA